jgi:DNA polymerase-3 subunit gamma/tau
MDLAPTFAIGFEMTLLRMLTFRPAPKVETPSLAYEKKTKKTEEVAPPIDEDWPTLLTQLKLTGLALSAAENAEFLVKSGREIRLRVFKGHQSLFTEAVIARIEKALEAHYKEAIKIALSSDERVQSSPAQQKQSMQNLRQQEAEKQLQDDPFFQQLKQSFSAEVIGNSVTSVQQDEL